MILLTVIYMLGMVKAGRPPRYYDTIILFAVGMWYSLLKNQIEVLVMKNDYVYTFVFLLLMTVHFVAYRDSWEYGANGVSILEMGFWYTVWAVAFTLLVVVASMKITFCNSILSWFGKHVFSVYILQRLPMIVLSKFGLAENHKYMFLIATLIITIFIAMIFDCMTEKIWEKSK